jgi:hypothetical protein
MRLSLKGKKIPVHMTRAIVGLNQLCASNYHPLILDNQKKPRVWQQQQQQQYHRHEVLFL